MPALVRRDPTRRYPILLTLLGQSATDVLDEVVALFDQAVSARESRARHKLADQLVERAKRSEDKLALAEEILSLLGDPSIPDAQVGGLLRERIGMARLRAALAAPTITRLPRDHGHLAAIESSYAYLRQFTPHVLAAVSFASGPAAGSLLAAVEVLRGLNASGGRSVPADAPAGFVPTRWAGYLDAARASGDATAYRHYRELCVLLGLRDGLRSGDVHVPVRAAALSRIDAELHGAIGELDTVLAAGNDELVRLDEDGQLVIGKLTAEDLPTEVEELKAELSAMLPYAPLASVLIELDRATGFLDCFTHAGGATPRSPELKRNLLAVIIAQATNIGLARMAHACGIATDTHGAPDQLRPLRPRRPCAVPADP